MSPLSIFAYFMGNKRKVGPLIGIICLSIVSIAATGAITGSLRSTALNSARLYDVYTVVFSSGQGGLSPNLAESIRHNPAVASVIPATTRSTKTRDLFGSRGAPIYFVPGNDMESFSTALKWKIREGRLPAPNTNEIVLTKDIAANKRKAVGDEIGRDVDNEDFLQGRWRLVGIVGGPVPGGMGDRGYTPANFVSLEGVSGRTYALFVQARDGMQKETESFVLSLKSTSVEVDTASTVRERVNREFDSLDFTLWFLITIGITAITFSVALLNIIFFMQRANEFGLLAALGYTKRFLVGKTLLEVLVAILLGWGIGILGSEALFRLINAFAFEPRGLPTITALTTRVITFTIPIPLAVAFFSVGVVTWHLWRLDPVSIIERRD